MRNQDAIIKFARTTGELKWILGPHENWGPDFQEFLLQPTAASITWPYHAHSPSLLPNGNLLLFDNGNYRASPFDGNQPVADADNFSRAVEFEIDEESKAVTEIWEFRGSNKWYTPTRGDVDFLYDSGNYVITFGDIQYENGQAVGDRFTRIVEVTREKEVVFDLEVTSPGYDSLVYRSERIRLYPAGYVVKPLRGEGDCDADGIKSLNDLYCVESTAGRNYVLDFLKLPIGDFNGDGFVDFGDFLVLSKGFGQSSTSYCDGDLNLDKKVDFLDFLELNFKLPSVRTVPEPTANLQLAVLIVFHLGRQRTLRTRSH